MVETILSFSEIIEWSLAFLYQPAQIWDFFIRLKGIFQGGLPPNENFWGGACGFAKYDLVHSLLGPSLLLLNLLRDVLLFFF